MKPEDLYLYYSSIEGVEYVHTYWNILKVTIKKENKTEENETNFSLWKKCDGLIYRTES